MTTEPQPAGISPSDKILTIPNVVSIIRLLAIPLFWWILLGLDQVGAAAWLVGAIATTDWIDGYLARRLGQVSRLGIFLDPLADRLVIASAVIGGLIVGVLPPIIGYPLIVREVMVGGGALWVSRYDISQIKVRPLGKAATMLVYVAVPSFYLYSDAFLTWLWGPIAWVGGTVGLFAYYVVGIMYFFDLRSASLKNRSNLVETAMEKG